MRTFLRALCAVAASLIMLMGVASAAQAQALTRIKHPATKLTLTTPKGFTVSYKNGFYTVRNRKSYAVFGRGVSPLSVQQTGTQLLKSSGGKLVGKATSTASMWRGTISAKKRVYVLTVRKVGANVDISIMGVGSPPARSKHSRRIVLRPGQVQQVLVLDAILRSRRGGAPAVLNVPLPMRLAQTDDQGARANVPDLPGWTVTGGGGLFAVEHPTLGFGWYGMTIVAATPSFSFSQPSTVIATPSADPRSMLIEILPQYLAKGFGQQFAFTDVQIVPGSEGIFGPTIPSAMYSASFTYKGIAMTGLFAFGITTYSQSFTQVYLSAIGVANGAPGGVAPALLQSWVSASGAVGFRQRFSVTLEAVAKDQAAILTPTRFRQDASTWIDLVQSGAIS